MGPLTSKDHPADTHAGQVESSVVSISLNWARLVPIPEKSNLSNHYHSNPYIRGAVYRGQLKESCGMLPKLHEAWRVCNLKNN